MSCTTMATMTATDTNIVEDIDAAINHHCQNQDNVAIGANSIVVEPLMPSMTLSVPSAITSAISTTVAAIILAQQGKVSSEGNKVSIAFLEIFSTYQTWQYHVAKNVNIIPNT